MSSEPQSWIDEGVVANRLVFDVVGWQKVQSRFSEVIGANLHFVLPSENFTCFSTSFHPSCFDLVCCENALVSQRCRCVEEAFRYGLLQGETIITCVHRLNYCVTPIQYKALSVGTVLVGPVVLGKRESFDVFKKMCKEEGIDQARFLDRVHELSVFSFGKIHMVLGFVKEMARYAVRSHFDTAVID